MPDWPYCQHAALLARPTGLQDLKSQDEVVVEYEGGKVTCTPSTCLVGKENCIYKDK